MKFLKLLMITGFIASSLLFTESSYSQALTDDDKIQQYVGSYYSSFSVEQKEWLLDCLSRCEIISYSASDFASLPYPTLETLGVNTKFVSTLTVDYVYDPNTFNPLKYYIDFFQETDQYFKIANTGYVLKVIRKS